MLKIDLIVTRHLSLVEYLKFFYPEQMQDVEVITHVPANKAMEILKNKHVVGVLPHHLSCICRTFTEIPLDVPSHLRGKELSELDIQRYAGKPVSYMNHREEFSIFHEAK